MLLLMPFAFLAGVVTILSPCILPILPIILSSGVHNSKSRPIGIILGFICSFTFFTLYLSTIIQLIGISADHLRHLSLITIGVSGLTLLVPQMQKRVEIIFSQLANKPPAHTYQTGFGGGLLIGLSLGLIWTPCVGPILASIISLAIIGQVSNTAVLIMLAYSIGTAIPMLIIMYSGRQLFAKSPFLINQSASIQKAFGLFMILSALAIYSNLDRKFQTYLLNTFPQYGAGLTTLEDHPLIQPHLNQLTLTSNETVNFSMTELPAGSMSIPPAPEIIPGGQWFNANQLQLSELSGKIILIDFWSYSCVSCIRSLPYLRLWHQKYQNQGLTIIGVHSPRFEYEKNSQNVQKAIDDFQLQYPIVQDNNLATWQAYRNRVWPTVYLIDSQGHITYTHLGDGNYDQLEDHIQQLLTNQAKANKNTHKPAHSIAPQLQFGYENIDHLIVKEKVIPHRQQLYSPPSTLINSSFAYQGLWQLNPNSALPGKFSQLQLKFESKEVFLEVKPKNNQPGKIELELDGLTRHLDPSIEDGILTVNENRHYRLVNLPKLGIHTLNLKFLDENLEILAFTFE